MTCMTYGHPEIDALSVEEKINPSFPYADFQEYLGETPEALTEFAQILSRHTGKLKAEHVLALGSWAKQHGMDVDLVDETTQVPTLLYGGDLKIKAYSKEQANMGANDISVMDDLKEAEKIWLREGQWAPVVVIEFRGQYTTPSGEIGLSDDESRCHWDGSLDMFTVAFDDRNAHCITDSYESDNFKDMSSAPDMAVNWYGPYEVRVALFRPSARFISLKEQFRLDMDTPQANSSGRAGMRL